MIPIKDKYRKTSTETQKLPRWWQKSAINKNYSQIKSLISKWFQLKTSTERQVQKHKNYQDDDKKSAINKN